MKTWQGEALVVAALLGTVAWAGGGAAREWVGAAGVMGSFLHAQVSDRLAEEDAAVRRVACSPWAERYFLVREVAWASYFISGHCWAALAGCAIFLVYPMWRRVWRRFHPRSK